MNQEIYERLRKISERLKKEYHAEKVILYGSYARGEGTEDSDVDLLIVAPTNERMIDRMVAVLHVIDNLSLDLEVWPIVLTPQEFKQKMAIDDAFIETIIEEGVSL